MEAGTAGQHTPVLRPESIGRMCKETREAKPAVGPADPHG